MSELPKSPTFRIQVDEESINLAIPEDSGNCMISTAIRKCYPETKYVSVDINTIRFTENGYRRLYWTPEVCRRHLFEFDNGVKPDPFEFELSYKNIAQTTNAAPSTNRKSFERKDYEPIRMAIVKTVTEKPQQPTVPIRDFAEENELAPGSVSTYLSPRGTIPSPKTTKKILTWAKDKVPDSPLAKIADEKIKELDEKFLRDEKSEPIKKQLRNENRSNPERIGGRPLPVSRLGLRRVFGERKFENKKT